MSELVYLPVDEEEQWRRVEARFVAHAATTFEMTRADLIEWRKIFQPPDDAELTGTVIDPPPLGFDSWEEWVAQWWPPLWPATAPDSAKGLNLRSLGHGVVAPRA